MKLRDKLTLLNIDCMEYMASVPDKYFDLAVVDPPYGIDADVKNNTGIKQTKKSATRSKKYGSQLWDSDIPSDKYFYELNRISKRQIIWGANYFGMVGGMIYWHKNVTMPTYSTGELAWVSWMNKLDFIDIPWHGMIQHDMKNKEQRIHATQKPVRLYDWIYDRYASENCKVIDTHLGSGSNAIAAHYSDKVSEFVGCELDKDYYNDMIKRVRKDTEQLKLF